MLKSYSSDTLSPHQMFIDVAFVDGEWIVSALLCSHFEPYQLGSFNASSFSNFKRTLGLINSNLPFIYCNDMNLLFLIMQRELIDNNEYDELFSLFHNRVDLGISHFFIDLKIVNTGLINDFTGEASLIVSYFDVIRHIYLSEAYDLQNYALKSNICYMWLNSNDKLLNKEWKDDIINYASRKI